MVSKVDMSVNLGGIQMKNPVNTAAGAFGFGRQFEAFFDVSKLGAITTKGCAPEPWPGNPAPRMCEITSGMMNSVGLANPGVKGLAANFGEYLGDLEKKDCRVICQVAGHSIAEYIEAIELFEELLPQVAGYELNISCPNIDSCGASAGQDPKSAAEVVRAVRPRTSHPLLVKLAPVNVAEIGKAVEDTGADAISVINSIPGMSIDINTRKSRLSKPTGGISGPCIHNIAVRMVWEAYNAVNIPICGMGGIVDYKDAAEFILAGATAVSIGMMNFAEPTCALEVVEGLEKWAESQGVASITELIGAFEC